MPGETTKVVRESNGDTIKIFSGGAIIVMSGGNIRADAGVVVIPNLTAATGTTGNTITDVGGAFNQGTLNNNFKALADKVNAINGALIGLGAVSLT